ncbi:MULTISPECIES: hypothetical protein [unclassified Paraburkholderia]|uniref:hypothetical protein n=1 Tax=unclassified Paraburkholderia TaxID=2615204 RepID=UPI002AB27F24|nr:MULTISPECIES: hypothetical protein [unclassified Paraburkholderia]
MADRFELVALALPPDRAPESLPACVTAFIAACWNGMSRAQLLDRARRLALRASLRIMKAPATAAPGGACCYSLVLVTQAMCVELIAHVRVVRRRGPRRAKVSLPPPRDARQGGLF